MATVNIPHVKSYFLSDGTLTGFAEVLNITNFWVGATCFLASDTEPLTRCIIRSVKGNTLGFVKVGGSGGPDLSGFVAADHAYVEQLAQTITDDGLIHSPPPAPKATVAALTFWVDSVNGSDNNPGTQSQPCATINYVLDNMVPDWLDHAVTFNVKTGTYKSIKLGKKHRSRGGSMTFTGTDWITPTLTSGLTSGTFTSISGRAGVLATGGWTVNDLIGKFCRINSGSLSGKIIPITSNDGTSISFPMWNSDVALGSQNTGLVGASFDIVLPGAIFDQDATDASTKYSMYCTGEADNFSAPIAISNILFKGNNGIGIVARNEVVMTSCMFDQNQGLVAGVILLNPVARVTLTDCGFRFSNGALPISPALWTTIVATRCSFISSVGLFTNNGAGSFLTLTNCYITGGGSSSTAIRISTPSQLSLTFCTIESCLNGIDLSTNAIQVSLNNCTIQNHTTDGIVCGGGGKANIVILASKIAGNGRFGVNLHRTQTCTHSSAKINTDGADNGANMIMSGNVSGDFSLDGTTGISKATLAADPDTVINESVWFNVLIGGSSSSVPG